MRLQVLSAFMWLGMATNQVAAQEAALPTTTIRNEAPVIVTGAVPGPAMWRVSRDGHVMHVLGTVSPLPKRMEWKSQDVEDVLAQAGEVLLPPGYVLGTDLGFFGKLTLLPTLLGVRRNPDNASLRDVVPPHSYERWRVLSRKYLGRDRDAERMRPLFAAHELYEAAIDQAGLSGKSVVSPVVEKGIRRHGIKRTRPQAKTTLKDPKAALKEFRAQPLSDGACFDRMLQNLEADVARMVDRANAWAVGDVEALRALPLGDQYQACRDALMQAAIARKHGVDNAEAEVRQAWLTAAEAAIANNEVSLALLPMSELLEPDGYLAALVAKGYDVESP